MFGRIGWIFGILALLLIGGVAATLGYQAGLAQGLASAGSAGGTVVVGAPYWGGPFVGFGFGIFGFLFTILVVALLLRLAFGIGRGGWHRGGPGPWGGPGHWTGGPDRWAGGPERDRIAEWHRRLHEADAADRGGSADAASPERS